MDKAIRLVEEYLKDNYGGMLLPLEKGLPYTDPEEELLCCFSFPDDKLRAELIGKNPMDFKDLILLFLYDLKEKEVFLRVCNGEAKGMSWEQVQMLCGFLEKGNRERGQTP